ncbi:PorT family protein [Chryseobacterium piperi]|uniref:outer membrane beta-barrel protein n=1 Tax=Chryseobacterium piperi TaxID=558152 RepID=UPI00068BDB41|nr:outer membrane beta-barrel protein [Chryseobacterium piperi]ASW75256.1 PorT family protein [Chryseobacterium piperi]
MSNQWLNDLRRKMEDHTDDVPDELWDHIKDDLFSKEDENTIAGLPIIADEGSDEVRKEKTQLRPWAYRIAGIAAAIALFFIIGKQMLTVEHKEEKEPKISYSVKEGKNENPDAQTSSIINNGKESAGHILNSLNKKGTIALQKSLPQNEWKNTIAEDNNYLKFKEAQPLITLPGQYGIIGQNQISSVQYNNLSITRREAINELLSEEDISLNSKPLTSLTKVKKSKSHKSWMLSMLTGKASSESQQFPGYATMGGKPLSIDEVWSASEYSNDPFMAVLLANQSENVEATVRHKVPLNLGISLYYNLGKRWGIGTGINYTKLSSELHSGSQSNFVKSEQTVHYIGIPVQVNYNVIQKGPFTGYVTAGALVEKSVASSFTTKYIVNNEVKDETRERLESQPVQVSLNSALGLQLKVVKNIGVYAEPGIGYHFKDESSLNTIYKEKPLNFNVKFGIRILLD